MIYIDLYNTKEWCEKHGLEVCEFKCANCGEMIKTTVPVLDKDYAGLETPDHGCPKRFAAARFTPISDKENAFWKKII